MDLVINDGQRPSRLQIDRQLTGEIDDPEVRAWLAQNPVDLPEVPPFDAQALRARATVVPAPVPANNHRFFAVVALAVAAMAMLALAPGWLAASSGPIDDPAYVGVRGTALSVYHLQDGVLAPYDARVLGDGDTLGFKVDPGVHDGVVLLSVDGTGAIIS